MAVRWPVRGWSAIYAIYARYVDLMPETANASAIESPGVSPRQRKKHRGLLDALPDSRLSI